MLEVKHLELYEIYNYIYQEKKKKIIIKKVKLKNNNNNNNKNNNNINNQHSLTLNNYILKSSNTRSPFSIVNEI